MKEVRLNKKTITYFKTLAGETGIPDQNLINPCSKECARQVKNLDLNGHPDEKWQATLPVTLPAATQTHPIPPNPTQLSALWYCLINQLFTVVYGMGASDSKSRAPLRA